MLIVGYILIILLDANNGNQNNYCFFYEINVFYQDVLFSSNNVYL